MISLQQKQANLGMMDERNEPKSNTTEEERLAKENA